LNRVYESRRRRLVEVAAALGLPLPTLSPFAVAALAGPFDLGRGPLERGSDLVGLDLGDRPLLPLGRFPAALAQPPGDHHPVPYESGPWTSQNHGPAGKTLLNPNELVRLGRRYLADQVAEGHALGLQVGAWLARGTGPAAMADACERLQVQRAILPGKLARPSLRDRVLGRTLADFQARVPARITLVNDDDVLAESDQIDLPGPGADPPAQQRRTTSSAA
jgi:hypothetical protein